MAEGRDPVPQQPEPEQTPRSGGLSRRGAKAYQWAMEAVFSIPIAGGLGWWADSAFGTGPWGLVVGLGVGFVAFVRRLLDMRKLVEDPEDGDDGA